MRYQHDSDLCTLSHQIMLLSALIAIVRYSALLHTHDVMLLCAINVFYPLRTNSHFVMLLCAINIILIWVHFHIPECSSVFLSLLSDIAP